ncbi:MAG: glutathione S-transferase family protein [Brevundimonas sp.]|uniref:glutathione S-transferase family protein n=1 Tax=Brevundimonas sp. TaxID=1871086 RepID=UPI0040349813
MGFTVYGAAGSGSVPVEAVLTLVGAPHRVVEAATWEGEAERDKVAGANPMRQIPALITPEGETITESAAILLWLTERFPEAGLAPPPGDPRRGQFLRWMSFIPASIYSMYWVRDEPGRLVGDDATAQATVLERTADRIAHCWSVMEAQVTPGRFLMGEDLTVLDLYVAVVSRWRPLRSRFHAVAPRMGEVVRRVDALPDLQAFWAERFPFEGDYAGPFVMSPP